MEPMIFSYDDYVCKKDFFPRIFTSGHLLSRKRYFCLINKYDKSGRRVVDSLDAIRQRTPKQYFEKLNSAQVDALSYSERVFPAYRLILPDAIMDDWMAIMDPHKQHKRDHSLHQPQTAYIVSKLLGFGNLDTALQCPQGGLLEICVNNMIHSEGTKYLRDHLETICPLVKDLPSTIKNKIWRDAFYQACVVSALFHDIGYPWQYINSLNESIKAAEFREGDSFPTDINKLYDSVMKELIHFPFFRYRYNIEVGELSESMSNVKTMIKYAFDETHGFPGAVGYLGLNNATLQEKKTLSVEEGVYRFIMDYASVGIMMHDMEKMYRKKGYHCFQLSFDKDPLSCIIAMADVIEEFYRPSCEYYHSAEDIVTLYYKMPGQSTNVSIDLKTNEMLIEYKYSNDVKAAANRFFRVEEIDHYFNGDQPFVNLSALGIRNVRCITSSI